MKAERRDTVLLVQPGVGSDTEQNICHLALVISFKIREACLIGDGSSEHFMEEHIGSLVFGQILAQFVEIDVGPADACGKGRTRAHVDDAGCTFGILSCGFDELGQD